MRKRSRRIFGYPDIHWTERDKKALAVAMKAREVFKPDEIVCGGDLTNAGPFARHAKLKLDQDRAYDYLTDEIEPTRDWLIEEHKQCRTGKVHLLMGNHDDWFERWCLRIGIDESLKSLRPSVMWQKDNPWLHIVPFGRLDKNRRAYLKLHPKLVVIHGWAANKYAAETHLQMAKPYSVIYHHTHRAEMRSGTMLNGEVVHSMCAGCLCKKQPIYALGGSPTGWTHGFWVAYLGHKTFTMYSIPIWKDWSCVLPDGQEVRL